MPSAKKQAEAEIFNAFGIRGEFENSEDLDIFSKGEGNAALLAFSVLMLRDQSEADLTELLTKFATDAYGRQFVSLAMENFDNFGNGSVERDSELDTNGTGEHDDDNDDDLSFVLQYSEAFTFASTDRISFASLPAPYAETKEIKKLDKLLTPDEAIDAAAGQLAKYMKLTALRLDLVYVPVSQSGDEAGESVIMTPYWQLDFGLKPMAEHYALINAETGKVSYVEPN